MAAMRGGIGTVILPEENRKDLVDLPKSIAQHMKLLPVKWIDEVLDIALERPLAPRPAITAEPLPAPTPTEPRPNPDVKH